MSQVSPPSSVSFDGCTPRFAASPPRGPYRQSRETQSKGGGWGAGLVGPQHACGFFTDAEDEYRVLLPFASDCAHRGEKCLHYLDSARHGERLERLAEAGIDVQRSSENGRLEIRTWDNAYLRGGRFDPDDMLDLIDETLGSGRRFGRTRLWANMEWVLKALPGSDSLAEYESRLNPIVEKHNGVVICAYQHGKYNASVVMDILRAHPMLIVGDVLQPNPLYVPTEQYLDDLLKRRAPRPGLRSAGNDAD
jgi:hypothetical protein